MINKVGINTLSNSTEIKRKNPSQTKANIPAQQADSFQKNKQIGFGCENCGKEGFLNKLAIPFKHAANFVSGLFKKKNEPVKTEVKEAEGTKKPSKAEAPKMPECKDLNSQIQAEDIKKHLVEKFEKDQDVAPLLPQLFEKIDEKAKDGVIKPEELLEVAEDVCGPENPEDMSIVIDGMADGATDIELKKQTYKKGADMMQRMMAKAPNQTQTTRNTCEEEETKPDGTVVKRKWTQETINEFKAEAALAEALQKGERLKSNELQRIGVKVNESPESDEAEETEINKAEADVEKETAESK